MSFRWGRDPSRQIICNYDSENKELGEGPVGILYIDFSDEQKDFQSLKISSKWPKSVLGIKPVFDAVIEKIGYQDPGLPIVKVREGWDSQLSDEDPSGYISLRTGSDPNNDYYREYYR